MSGEVVESSPNKILFDVDFYKKHYDDYKEEDYWKDTN